MSNTNLHVLYRMFDAAGQLLYVGLTNNPKGRFGNHRDTKDWWDQVSTIKVESFSSREELIAAERTAIGAEKPLHNRIHNRDRIALDEDIAFFDEEEIQDRCMGIAFAKIAAEERYGLKRKPDELAALYADYVSEARADLAVGE